LTGHTIFVSPDPSVLNNNNSHGELSVKEELYGFGEGFLERWSSEPKLADNDPIFMALNGKLSRFVVYNNWCTMLRKLKPQLQSSYLSHNKVPVNYRSCTVGLVSEGKISFGAID